MHNSSCTEGVKAALYCAVAGHAREPHLLAIRATDGQRRPVTVALPRRAFDHQSVWQPPMTWIWLRSGSDVTHATRQTDSHRQTDRQTDWRIHAWRPRRIFASSNPCWRHGTRSALWRLLSFFYRARQRGTAELAATLRWSTHPIVSVCYAQVIGWNICDPTVLFFY